MRVKICGLTTLDTLDGAINAGAAQGRPQVTNGLPHEAVVWGYRQATSHQKTDQRPPENCEDSFAEHRDKGASNGLIALSPELGPSPSLVCRYSGSTKTFVLREI